MTSDSTSKPSRAQIENALAGSNKRANSEQKRRNPEPDFSFDASPRRQQVIGGDLSGISKRKRTGLLGKYGEISIANWVAGFLVLLILVAFFWPKSSEPIREVNSGSKVVPDQSIYQEARLDDVAQPEVQEQPFGREDDLQRAKQFRQADELDGQIRTLLAAAERYVEKGAYTEPKSNNATAAYQNILRLNPNNVAAKQGLDYISSRFLEAGLAAIQNDDVSQAQASLAKLETVDNGSDQYRELSASIENWKIQNRIDRFLSDAEAAIESGKLILPARESALYFYQQALILDDGNSAATQGINNIANSYVDRANEAILQGQYEAATGYLATVSVIDPKHQAIPLLDAMITKAEPIADRTSRRNTSSRDDEQQNPRAETPASAVAVEQIEPDNAANERSQQVSSSRTPSKEADEQATFDKQYLNRGLAAYYRGDYNAAAALLQPLADKGVSRAQLRIAYMHFLGRGFKRDRNEADRIVRAALPAIQKFADEGRAWAQSDLGSLYEDGLVLPRDYAEAVYWYRSAAENGYPGAQTNLGIMYARGRGVTTSRRTAIEWFQRAAKQGDIVARKNLEAMGVKE